MGRREVEDRAYDALAKAWDGWLPIDPEAVASRLGVEVRDAQGAFEPEVSGAFVFEGKNPVCFRNLSEHPHRQRFTLAHELGHYLLGHGGGFRDKPENFNTSTRDPREIEANQFAAALLMPDAQLYQDIVNNGITDVAELARRYWVSRAAMEWRIKALGYAS